MMHSPLIPHCVLNTNLILGLAGYEIIRRNQINAETEPEQDIKILQLVGPSYCSYIIKRSLVYEDHFI